MFLKRRDEEDDEERHGSVLTDDNIARVSSESYLEKRGRDGEFPINHFFLVVDEGPCGC